LRGRRRRWKIAVKCGKDRGGEKGAVRRGYISLTIKEKLGERGQENKREISRPRGQGTRFLLGSEGLRRLAGPGGQDQKWRGKIIRTDALLQIRSVAGKTINRVTVREKERRKKST